jgi:type IV secretory pathway VirJ component
VNAEPGNRQGGPAADWAGSADWRLRHALVGLCACLALFLSRPLMADLVEETAASDFGTVHLIHPDEPATGLLIYVAGAKGWNPATDGTARALADLGYLVAGVEPGGLAPAGASGACRDLGADLSRLADWMRERAELPAASLPILLGEAEGASLVYAALAQSPAQRFHAALTLDFCPASPVELPLCPGVTGNAPLLRDGRLQPAQRVETTWFALSTDRGPSCPGDPAAAFIARVDNARLVSTGTGSTTAPPGDGWMDQLTALAQWLDPRIPNQVGADAAAKDIAGLPLTEVRAEDEDPGTFAVMLSGDGGWAALDRGVSAALAAHGIATVGWDSLGYYWKARSPDEAGRDLARVLRHYLNAWGKARVVLIGYSFGADVLPFLANRLPPDLRASVILVGLLGASPTAAFEFHLSDWVSDAPTGSTWPVLPELRRLGWTKRLCIYGADEDDSLCPSLTGAGVQVTKVPGDHHFNEDYAGVADLILKAMGADARLVP